jgi:uncharacterized OB-fold protein
MTSSPPARLALVEYLDLDGDAPALQANRCEGCGALFLDRRIACARCGGRSFARHRLADTGRLRTFTIVTRSRPGVAVPFVSAVVDLDGGGVVRANLTGVEPVPEAIELGMPVRLCTTTVATDDAGTEAVGFAFAPSTDGNRGE